MTHFPVSGSYRLGGREMRRGRGTGSGGSGGGVGGIEESSSGLVGSWRSRDCASRFGLLTCVGLAGVRGDSGAGAWTTFGLLGVADVGCVDWGVCSVGTEGGGFGHWLALLVGSCEAVGCCERIEGVAGV